MMKKILLSLLVVAFATSINAQVETPQPSPKSKLEQKVGLTDVTIEYSRPGVKGRKIFGDLVPYGKVWRTGANENTKITFSNDVVIDGKTLKKGTYALYTRPNANSWDIIFYSDANNWGNPRKWDESKVALSTTTKVFPMPMNMETFMIVVDDITDTSAMLGILWEKSYVGIKFEVPTAKLVDANITKVMSGPSASDYYNAAVYYFGANRDINKAKVWIDKAINMTSKNPRFWYIYRQALIHKKAGSKKTARKAAKLSKELAQKAGNTGYVKMNEKLLKSL